MRNEWKERKREEESETEATLYRSHVHHDHVWWDTIIQQRAFALLISNLAFSAPPQAQHNLIVEINRTSFYMDLVAAWSGTLARLSTRDKHVCDQRLNQALVISPSDIVPDNGSGAHLSGIRHLHISRTQ